MPRVAICSIASEKGNNQYRRSRRIEDEMSKSKQAPGPYHWDGYGINDANGQRIAKMSDVGVIQAYADDGTKNPEFDRVGMLLAAAPDLLEACHAIAALSDGQGRRNMIEVAGTARRAIAKANGHKRRRNDTP